MAGKRLLDVAALFNASRGVAQKHVALRSRQLDVYTRTSTLARAVQSQTDRVTETIKAASFLASRLNEDAPRWTSDDNGKAGDGDSIPSKKSTAGPPQTIQQNRINQDHFYERSANNSAVDKLPGDELNIQQERADRYPLSDGTIPPSQSNLEPQGLDQDIVSDIPTDEPSKQPLDTDGIHPVSSGESTIPEPAQKPMSSEHARFIQRQSEAQIPSKTTDAFGSSVPSPLAGGHDEDSFYQPSTHDSPVLSSLPRVKLPKHTSSVQEGGSHLEAGQINSDSFYSAEKMESGPSAQAVPEQEQIPEGINISLFHSQRVARILGGRTQCGKQGELHLKGATDTPINHTDLAADKDQDTFSVRPALEKVMRNNISSEVRSPSKEDGIEELAYEISNEVEHSQNQVRHADQAITTRNLSQVVTQTEADGASSPKPYELRESKVPSSRLGRMWNYGGLAVSMFGGAISESLRRVSGSGGHGSYMLSAGNMDRLVTKLSRMRGAALKLGQLISFQDSKMLPGPIQEVLQRVQDRADYMPPSQRDKVLVANLGPDWRSLFTSFDEKPLAAASIGQVHSAVLKSNGARVAVKIQYPGVADSIDSDLSNLGILLTASRLLPKGLFLDKTIANARTELAWECDYVREAECGRRFEELLADEEDVFIVPKVYDEASGKQVLTMEFMDGVGVTRVQNFSQEQKDWIGTQILRLCLREITEFKFMQTDPNWTNFLYNAQTNKLELLDFGASREYPEEFISKYTRLLAAASRTDRQTVRDLSTELGYLTGQESKGMLDAHIASVLTLAEPFLDSSPEVYDFRDQTITDRVKEQIPLMIRERLAPPPEETYSLHRKLSGAFLLCARLGSRVRCRELFQNSMSKAGIL